MSGRVDGETAVVTGAAQGTGEAIARKLGAAGAAVVIADRQAGKADDVAADLREEGDGPARPVGRPRGPGRSRPLLRGRLRRVSTGTVLEVDGGQQLAQRHEI